LYIDIETVNNMFSYGKVKEYLYPHIPKGKIEATRFLISGQIQRVNYGAWIRRQARDIDLNGYVKYLNDGNVCVVVTGEILKIEVYNNIFNDTSSIHAYLLIDI